MSKTVWRNFLSWIAAAAEVLLRRRIGIAGARCFFFVAIYSMEITTTTARVTKLKLRTPLLNITLWPASLVAKSMYAKGMFTLRYRNLLLYLKNQILPLRRTRRIRVLA